MQIWKVYGEERYIAAQSKQIVALVLNIPKGALTWQSCEQVVELFTRCVTIECILEPPMVQLMRGEKITT